MKLPDGVKSKRLYKNQYSKSSRVWINPGCEMPEHSTGSNREKITVEQGRASLCSEDVSVTIEQGGHSIVPPNKLHSVKNEGEEVLVYVYVLTFGN